MTDEEKDKHKKEYEKLLALFLALLKSYGDIETEEDALEALAEMRAEIAMQHAFIGFEIDEEDALLLLQNIDDYNLTEQDKKKRDRLVAAAENLIAFSVCQEYQVYKQIPTIRPDFDLSDLDELDIYDLDLIQDYIDMFAKFNDTYMAVENADIEYAMSVALMWIGLAENTYLEYMTMNDDRVRPWHYALQGFTEKMSDFPSWMIPPIEWACRCFLVPHQGSAYASADLRDVKAKIPQKPPQIDDTFSESVATCGRIFGKSHPYFTIEKKDRDMVDRIVNKIKKKYYGR